MTEANKEKEALKKDNAVNSPMIFFNIDLNDPRFEKYVELKKFMEIPAVEQIIFAKLEELKRMFQEETK
jgi:hypothetical protein